MSQSDDIYDLGKKLVIELGLENEVDTLSRWMAHDIAALIKEAEKATGDAKIKKTKECRDAILDLWKVRHELPNGKRPFESFEEIFRALESLDPENTTPRYFRSGRPDAAGANNELKQYLELMDGIDYAARVLIEFVLGEAAGLSVGPLKKWMQVARGAAAKGADIDVMRRLIRISDRSKNASPNDAEREMLETRLKRLIAFHGLAASTILSLQDILKSATSFKKPAKKAKKGTSKVGSMRKKATKKVSRSRSSGVTIKKKRAR